MTSYRRFSTVWQMGAGVAAFVVLALVLESGGLVDWATRLELGPERTVALPVALAVHRGVGWMGLEGLRRKGLVELARVGWSDDPVLLAEVKSKALTQSSVREQSFAKGEGVAEGLKETAGSSRSTSKAGAEGDMPAVRLPLKPMVGDPPLVSVLPEMGAVEVGKTRTVALAGDSMMAVGLASTLLREAPKYKSLRMVKAFKSGTGLARPEVFDWETEYPAMLQAALEGGANPDVVLVAIGANDGQGFVEAGTVYAFGSAGWKEIYQRRVEAFLAMLEADGATVVWVELPPMKSDVYNARIALINRIDYAVVKASPQAVWFSTAGIVGDAEGRFQEYGVVRGSTVSLRQADGIHLTDEGAVLLAARLLPWLGRQTVEGRQ